MGECYQYAKSFADKTRPTLECIDFAIPVEYYIF